MSKYFDKEFTRVDVRLKKVYRGILTVVKNQFEYITKKKKDESAIEMLLEKMQEYRKLYRKEKDYVKTFFMVASKIFKRSFKKVIIEFTNKLKISKAAAVREISSVKDLKDALAKLSRRENRDIVGSHPIFKLGKSITLNNEKNLETFWNFVFKDGATKLNDYSEEAKDDYRRILSKDLDNL